MQKIADIFKGVNCWNDLHTKIKKLSTTKDKGYIFEVFCKLFLERSGEYSNVWLHEEIPHTIAKKLLLSGVDHGVDVLVKAKGNRYLGVQCKWRGDETKRLNCSADKLANVFAHQKLDGYIIFSNASGVDKYTNEQIGTKLTTLLYADLELLDVDDFGNYKRILENKQPKERKLFKPREDQKEAIKKVISGFKKEDRGKLILPCGTGKTLTSLWIKEKMKPKKTLVLLPSLSLLRQTKEVWREQRTKPFEYLCVCSEKDIDIDNKNDVPNDAPSEIGFTGIGVFQDGEEIKKALSKREKDVVVFATYQSANKLKGMKFDLALCDEAHKTATKKKDSQFSFIHNNSNINCTKRLYMTATPRVTGDIKEGKKDEDNIIEYVADMNNEKLFGKELHRMSFREAIEKNILCDYKIILIETTEQNINEIERGSQISSKSLFNIYKEAQRKYKIKKAITFHSSIKLAEDFKETLSTGNTKTYHINGTQNTSQRSKILREFAENTKQSAITNARCLTEGIDVPSIDMVYFCGKRSSKIDIVQIVGRVLRKAENKKYGYVLLPIVHKKEKMEKENYEGEYKEVIAVLRAMQNHDERLEGEIRLRFYKKQNQNRNSIIQTGAINISKEINISEKDIHPYILQKTTPSKFLPFKDARSFVHTLKLKSNKEWREYHKSGKKPNDVPSTPNRTYKNKGWVSLGDWLGTGFRKFEEAREFVHSLKLKNEKEWKKYTRSGKKPNDIPSTPRERYKDKGWVSVGDWLGTGTIAPQNMQFRKFEEAREFVHSLKLKGQKEWVEYCKSGEKPDDIPANPSKVYKNKGWVSWGDWLGTGYRNFKDARSFVHTLKLKNWEEWREYRKSGKKPNDIPSHPNRTYKNKGWVSLGDWLGTGFRKFEEAREFVHSLKLKNEKEWEKYTRSGKKPNDIPSTPRERYKDKGWVSVGDWLGTGTIAPQNMQFRKFEEAREFVHSLKLKNWEEWREYCKSGEKPDDIPANPSKVYKNKGWVSWGDWLGTGYRNFKDARSFVHTLKLKNWEEWREYRKSGKKPNDIPSHPNRTYKNKGWVSLGDWLGTGFRKFEEAREFVHSLKLKNEKEWKKYTRSGKKPNDIPSTPRERYKDKGWVSVGDWLGTGTIAPQNMQFRKFEEAREFVHSLKLKGQKEWVEYCKSGEKPDDIPANPSKVYKNKGWVSWGDWLGTGYRNFKDARSFVHTLKLKNWEEWREYRKSGKKPNDIPSHPNRTYKNKGWVSLGDWLGTGFRKFEEAREFVHSLKLKNEKEWEKYTRSGKKPNDIPSTPRERYKDKGWVSVGDWLGTGTIAPQNMQFRKFEEAREFVHSLKLKNWEEWREYCKSGEKPDDIPANPSKVYKNKGWVSWGDWLGTGYRNFKDARSFVHTLKLKNWEEWREYRKSGKKPNDIPSHPNRTYKNKGWVSLGDWLGTGFRKFEEAREFVHSLKLKNEKEWKKYTRSGKKPNDIPSTPRERYKDKGWVSVGDWLGTGTIAPQNMQFRKFEEAREFVHSLKLKGQKEWVEYCKSGEKPDDIPANPSKVYKNKGWVSWGDWLGTGYRNFKDARSFVHTLKLKNWEEWREYRKSGKKPNDIPSHPNRTYKNKGWVSLGDWLGTGFRKFEEAREFVHSLKLKNEKEWKKYTRSGKKPNDIPSTPRERYKDKGWVSVGDWLGTGTIAPQNMQFRKFEEAREFVHSLKLKGQKEWVEYCKSGEKPNDIPSNPSKVYKNKGWVSWGDWLGTGRIATRDMQYMEFKEAREFVHSLKLKNREEWREYCKSGKKPNDIPSTPRVRYKDKGWVNMGDWLGKK